MTAGSNVFGRVLNGVPIGQECIHNASAMSATGQFVHIEQDRKARKKTEYKTWIKAILHAFEPY